MNKKNPTPENQKPKAKLHLSMREFSFFGKDNQAVRDEIKSILDSGHSLSLKMTQSTSLSTDLYTLDLMFASQYEMHIRFRRDEYKKGQVIVILQQEVSA